MDERAIVAFGAFSQWPEFAGQDLMWEARATILVLLE
jgi:hypothetical protein